MGPFPLRRAGIDFRAESPSADNSAGDIQEIFPDVPLQIGREFRERTGIAFLGELELDLILCVHFPYLLPPEVLSIPSKGCLNLHPAYLPWNRGWHTPSWAILEDTPGGATLHWTNIPHINFGYEVRRPPCDE